MAIPHPGNGFCNKIYVSGIAIPADLEVILYKVHKNDLQDMWHERFIVYFL